jgi:glutaredoxin 3
MINRVRFIYTLVIPLFTIFLAYTIHSKEADMDIRRDNDVVIYTIPGCGYCDHAMKLLKERGVSFRKIDVSVDRDKWADLIRETGAHTVPYIFISGQYIGGCSDLISLDQSGELKKLLDKSSS